MSLGTFGREADLPRTSTEDENNMCYFLKIFCMKNVKSFLKCDGEGAIILYYFPPMVSGESRITLRRSEAW